jgi:hypothetical protein
MWGRWPIMLSGISESMDIRYTRLARTVCLMCIVQVSWSMMGLKSRVRCFGSVNWKERKGPKLKSSLFIWKIKETEGWKWLELKSIFYFWFENVLRSKREGKPRIEIKKNNFVFKIYIFSLLFSSLLLSSSSSSSLLSSLFPFSFSSFSFLLSFSSSFLLFFSSFLLPSFSSFFFVFFKKKREREFKIEILSKINGNQWECCRENSCDDRWAFMCRERREYVGQKKMRFMYKECIWIFERRKYAYKEAGFWGYPPRPWSKGRFFTWP